MGVRPARGGVRALPVEAVVKTDCRRRTNCQACRSKGLPQGLKSRFSVPRTLYYLL